MKEMKSGWEESRPDRPFLLNDLPHLMQMAEDLRKLSAEPGRN